MRILPSAKPRIFSVRQRSSCASDRRVFTGCMLNSSIAQSFPPGTRFFSLDGKLFAQTQGDNWYTVNATGTLVKLDPNNAPSSPGRVFTGDRIREPEFLAALDPELRPAENRQFA